VARSMFRDVIDPSIHVGPQHPYTLPLSIAVHVVLVGTLIVIPLVAPAALPAPAVAAILAFPGPSVAPPPPPPPAPVGAAQIEQPKSTINQAAAPLEAPTDIAPEHQAPQNAQQLSAVESSRATVPGGEIGIPGGSSPPPPPSPRTDAPSTPVRPGGDVRPPAKIKDVKPIYPVIAQIAHVQGIVIVEATIGPSGKVQDAKVLRSHPLLETAALDAVRQWEFTPTLLNGSPVSVVMTVTVDFRLR
jgi:TonB family protein